MLSGSTKSLIPALRDVLGHAFVAFGRLGSLADTGVPFSYCTMLQRKTKYLLLASLFFGTVAASSGCAPDVEATDDQSEAIVSEGSIDDARRSGSPDRMAVALRSIASSRAPWNRERRQDGLERLVHDLDAGGVERIRVAYIERYAEDPEVTIRSDGLFDHLVRLPREEEIALISRLQAAYMKRDVRVLDDLLRRSREGALTLVDRQAYFAMLPRMGLWEVPVRVEPGDRSLDAVERIHLRARWAELSDVELDVALRAIEAAFPEEPLAAGVTRDRSIAVVVSSHGAQWEELMGWARPMLERGYHLQVFTPDGRPASFQRDSLSISTKTAPLGFGCRAELDPAGKTGELAEQILSKAVAAKRFDASLYGAVYLAGGLGFNEDVAVAMPDAIGGTTLTAHPDVAAMMDRILREKLPVIAICHGPTLFAAVRMPDTDEPLARGIATASLPPFEAYVGFTDRKEIQFTYNVNTHRVLEAAGASTSVLRDIASMSRVVKAHKSGIEVLSGPGPQAAGTLAAATIEVIGTRWVTD